MILVPLPERESSAFIAEVIAEFADEKVRAKHWPAAGARERAAVRIAELLRLGRDGDEHRFFAALGADGARVAPRSAVREGQDAFASPTVSGERVARVWIGPMPPPTAAPRARWLYQITVDPTRRGAGFGSATMRAIEALLARERIPELRLNVFAWNTPARRLYAACGYEVVKEDDVAAEMRKRL
ncbi:MAG: GNAT family N-acetyltransferase [Thermoplasmatota archaeon]